MTIDTETEAIRYQATKRIARYRYLKNNLSSRTLEELRKFQVSSKDKIKYCIKCIHRLRDEIKHLYVAT